MSTSDNKIHEIANRTAVLKTLDIRRIFKVTMVVLLAVVLVFCSVGCSKSKKSTDSETSSEQTETVDTNNDSNSDSKLMFVINPKGDISNDLVFQVVVSGTTSDGESVNDYYDATVGTKYQLNSKAGDYEFSVAKDSLTQNDTVYSVDTEKVSFKAKKDKIVKLTISVDENATKELAESKKQEEEKKAAEWEKRQQEEAAAAAQQQQDSSSSSASSTSTQDQSKTVYVTSSGKKYHSSQSCRTLNKSKNISSITLGEAVAQGYEPCSICGG